MITNNLVKRKKSSQNYKHLKMSSIIILSPVCKENKTKQNTQKLNQNRNSHWLEEGFLPSILTVSHSQASSCCSHMKSRCCTHLGHFPGHNQV